MISYSAVDNNGTTHYYPTIDPCMVRMIHFICSIGESYCFYHQQLPIETTINNNDYIHNMLYNNTKTINPTPNNNDNNPPEIKQEYQQQSFNPNTIHKDNEKTTITIKATCPSPTIMNRFSHPSQ